MTRQKNIARFIALMVCMAALMLTTQTSYSGAPARNSASVGVPSTPIADSPDFATLVLRDPWDMSEYPDVSQYINESGNQNLVQNIQVQNGVFSAQSTSAKDAWFFPLFPGYNTAMLIGKVGVRYPIASATYHCLYVAAKVDSGPPTAGGPDQLAVFWFADETLNGGSSPWGTSPGMALYPEAGSGTPTPMWKLYKMDLATVGTLVGTAWNGRSTWKGLRIDPTIQANVTFAIDWVRLTPCAVNNQTINWTPNPSISALYARPVGTTRYIRVATGLNGNSGSYTLDTQGLAAGSYTIGLGTNSSCCIDESTAPLVVNQTPIANFARPSFTSGIDYATQAGNAWDFSNSSDTTQIISLAYAFRDGVLDMTTQPFVNDPQIFLNTPQPIANTSVYRYLTFSMYTSGAQQNVPLGMVARWLWSTATCTFVSQDIPFDVGWQTYTVNLTDPFNGLPEETGGSCPPGAHWLNTTAINRFRFDPNENIMGSAVTQQLDWIRLTQVDRVTRGTPFLIQLLLNKPAQQIASLSYYYTDNLSNPTQNVAQPYSVSPASPPGSFRLFLPLINRDYTAVAGDASFLWNTAPVSAGEYYVCVVVNDGYNQAIYCSEAPMQVN